MKKLMILLGAPVFFRGRPPQTARNINIFMLHFLHLTPLAVVKNRACFQKNPGYLWTTKNRPKKSAGFGQKSARFGQKSAGFGQK